MNCVCKCMMWEKDLGLSIPSFVYKMLQERESENIKFVFLIPIKCMKKEVNDLYIYLLQTERKDFYLFI